MVGHSFLTRHDVHDLLLVDVDVAAGLALQQLAQVERRPFLMMVAHQRTQHPVAGTERHAEVIDEAVVRFARSGVIEHGLALHLLEIEVRLVDHVGDVARIADHILGQPIEGR